MGWSRNAWLCKGFTVCLPPPTLSICDKPGSLSPAQRQGIREFIVTYIIKLSTNEADLRAQKVLIHKLNHTLVQVTPRGKWGGGLRLVTTPPLGYRRPRVTGSWPEPPGN